MSSRAARIQILASSYGVQSTALRGGPNIIGIIGIFAAIARRCCVRQAERASQLSKMLSFLLVNIETNLAQTSLLLFEQTNARPCCLPDCVDILAHRRLRELSCYSDCDRMACVCAIDLWCNLPGPGSKAGGSLDCCRLVRHGILHVASQNDATAKTMWSGRAGRSVPADIWIFDRVFLDAPSRVSPTACREQSNDTAIR
jgi:hypothetical protein